jgi:hypothetical protein
LIPSSALFFAQPRAAPTRAFRPEQGRPVTQGIAFSGPRWPNGGFSGFGITMHNRIELPH